MTTHPTPPDQTAAAQEWEDQIRMRKELKYLGQLEIDTLSTQQPEPCVDVEALKREIFDSCCYNPENRSTRLYKYNQASIAYAVDQIASRGLLTGRTFRPSDIPGMVDHIDSTDPKTLAGRTEAKAVPRIEGLEYAIEQADRNTDESPIQDSDVRILAKAAERYIPLQEAEAKAEGDMVNVRAKASEAIAIIDKALQDAVNVIGTEACFHDGRCQALQQTRHIWKEIAAAPPVQQEQKPPMFSSLDAVKGVSKREQSALTEAAARQREQQPADTGDGRG